MGAAGRVRPPVRVSGREKAPAPASGRPVIPAASWPNPPFSSSATGCINPHCIIQQRAVIHELMDGLVRGLSRPAAPGLTKITPVFILNSLVFKDFRAVNDTVS